jgi:hypothetical protein
MLVRFEKVGDRRYGVYVERERAPDVMMWPAPGFDEFLPHDLLHFVAEAEWGLDGAVFGKLAAGGDAGTFLPVDRKEIPKAMRRRKLARRRQGGVRRPRGRRSEVLAYVLECAWNARHGRAALPDNWNDCLVTARVDPDRLASVVASLDDLAHRWHALRIGESLALEWPRPERHVRPRPRRRESVDVGRRTR